MFGSSYRICTVWGIPIRIHISLIVLFAIIAISSGMSGGVRELALLVGLEVGIFVSIALHELGHSFVALRTGCRVRDITLMFIGGAAQMDRISARPLHEFLMAIAGPLVSVVLGFACWYGGGELEIASNLWPLPFTRHYGIHCNVVQFLGVVNFALAAFNMLPAFPMDGGRVVRALLTRRMGRVKATLIAVRIGKYMALAFAVRGLMTLPGGWILVFMAFFLYSIAKKEYFQVVMEEQRRRGGVGEWPPFSGGNADPDDRVLISPPPYERGPAQESEIRPVKDGPFRDMFGR
jgi:Zn-dependent protease